MSAVSAPVVAGSLDLSAASRARGGSTSLRAYVARPEGEGPWPAVVAVMEIFGVNDDMRQHARRIASWGYPVVMPDLYSDGGARRCLSSTMRALQTERGRPYTDIETARQWAVAQPESTGTAGIIGFCMGGGFALVTADRERYDAASVNYGMLPDSVEKLCPVVGSYGARDRGLPGVATELRDRLDAAGVENDVREYPDSGHAFLNDEPPGPPALGPLLRVAGFGGSARDREAAWSRIEDFFADHLR